MNELVRRYLGNYQDRTIVTNSMSFLIGAVSGIGQLILGIYLHSPWFMANALYYLLLCSARGHALRNYRRAVKITDHRKRYLFELIVYKRTGIFICLSGIAYLFVCLRMYFAGDATVYRGYTVYLVALISFSKLVTAIQGSYATRWLRNPIVSTLKALSFTDAFVSIVMTQCTLLTMMKTENAVGYSAVVGMIVSLLFVIQGVKMLVAPKTYPSQPDRITVPSTAPSRRILGRTTKWRRKPRRRFR